MCTSYILIPYEDQWPTALRVALYLSGLLYCFLGLAVITQRFMVAMDKVVAQTREVVVWDKEQGTFLKTRRRIWSSTVADLTLLALGTSAAQISLSIISSVQQLGSINANQASGVATIAGGASSNLFPTLAWCTLVPLRGQVKRIEQYEVFLVETFWAVWAYGWLYIVVEVWTPGAITVVEAAMTVAQFPLLMAHAYAQDRRLPYLSFSLSRQEKVQPAPPAALVKTGSMKAKNSSAALLDGIRTSLDPEGDDMILQRESKDTISEIPNFGESRNSSTRTRDPLQDLVASSLNDHNRTHPDVFVSIDGFRRRSTGSNEKENDEGGSHMDSAQVIPVKPSDWTETSSGRPSSSLPESALPEGAGLSCSWLKNDEVQEVQERSTHGTGHDQKIEAECNPEKEERPFLRRWGRQIVEALVINRGLQPHPDKEHNHDDALSFERSWDLGGSLKKFLLTLLDALCLFWRVVFAVLVPPPDAWHGWPAFLASIVIIAGMCSFVVELSTLFSCASGIDSFIVAITLLATGSSIPNIISSGISASQSSTADSAIANANASNAINVFLGLGLPWIITSVYSKAVLNTDYPISTEGLGASLFVFFVTVALAYTVLIGRRVLSKGELGGSHKILIALIYILLWTGYIVFALLAFFKKV